MSLQTLRDQVQNWTLESDQKLFTAIQNLSQNIFQTQKNIQDAIRNTRYSLKDTDITIGNEFNHYLRISESKFTENKIGQKTVKQVEQNLQKKPKQLKPKLQMFKEALALGLKNLQIGEEDLEKDNMSMGSVAISQYSLTQAVFKNNRLPCLYGSEEFRKSKFMSLYFEDIDESRISVRTKKTVVPTSPQTGKKNNGNIIQANLAPPPSLDSVLTNNSIPPPISQNLPPPPPPLNLPTPSLSASILDLPPPPPPPTISSPLVLQSNQKNEIEEPKRQIVSPVIANKPLSMQQQLALRLQQGKNYKPPQQSPIEQNKPLVEQQRPNIRASIKTNNINELLKNSTNPFQKQTDNQLFEGQDEEEDSIFGKSKTRIKDKLLNNPIVPAKTQDKTKSTNSEIMSKQTFNEEILIKKKPQPIKQDNYEKKNDIFGEDESEEEVISFSRKAPKPAQNNKPIKKQVQKNVLLNEDQQEDTFFTKKKNDPFQKKPNPVIQKANPLDNKPNPISPIKQNPINPLKQNPLAEEKPISIDKKQIISEQKKQIVIEPKKEEIKMIRVLPMPQKKPQPIIQPKQQPIIQQKQEVSIKVPVQNVEPVFKKKAIEEQDRPPLPTIPKTNKKEAKKPSLFDDQQDDSQSLMFKKKVPEQKKPIAPKTEQIKVPNMKLINQSIAEENQKNSPIKKNVAIKQEIREVEDNNDSFLQVRRPKNRPKQVMQSFSEESTQVINVPAPKLQQKKKQPQIHKARIQSEPIVKVQQKPIINEVVENKPMKRIPGLGMGMGLPGLSGLPGLTSGIGFTRPGDARRMQQEAIQKQKQQNQKRKIEQEQLSKQKQQESLRQEQLKLQQEQLERLKDKQKQRIQQEQRQNRENQKRVQQEQQRLQRQNYLKEQLLLQQQEKHKKQQQERLKHQEEQRIRMEYAQRMRYQSEQKLRIEQQERGRLLQQQKMIQKRRLQQEERNLLKIERQRQQKKKLQEQTKQLPKIFGPIKSQPVNQGFVPKLPSKNPFGAVASTNVNPLPTVPKGQPKQPVNSKKPGGLFEQQDEDQFKPLDKKPKPQNKNKPKLFEDEEDDGFPVKNKKKNDDPDGGKKKKSLFDQDQDVPFPKKQKKIQAPVPQINQEFKPNLKAPSKKNNIFGDEDEVIITQKQAPTRPIQAQVQKKDNFEDAQDDEPFVTKAKPVKKILKEEDDEPFVPKARTNPVKTVPQTKKKNIFDDSD